MGTESDSELEKAEGRRAILASERERAAEEAFVRGVIERGEATKPDRDGKLPPGATHELVEEIEGKLPKIRRRRFSLR